MDIELKELKEKISDFINKYDIENIEIFISENLNGHKSITLQIEV